MESLYIYIRELMVSRPSLSEIVWGESLWSHPAASAQMFDQTPRNLRNLSKSVLLLAVAESWCTSCPNLATPHGKTFGCLLPGLAQIMSWPAWCRMMLLEGSMAHLHNFAVFHCRAHTTFTAPINMGYKWIRYVYMHVLYMLLHCMLRTCSVYALCVCVSMYFCVYASMRCMHVGMGWDAMDDGWWMMDDAW